jgi:hypothetical protein
VFRSFGTFQAAFATTRGHFQVGDESFEQRMAIRLHPAREGWRRDRSLPACGHAAASCRGNGVPAFAVPRAAAKVVV